MHSNILLLHKVYIINNYVTDTYTYQQNYYRDI